MSRTRPARRFFISIIRDMWEKVFRTRLYWLFLCFFQPMRFSEEFEYRTIAKRFTLLARLAIPLFLLIFLVALPVQGLLSCTVPCAVFSVFTWKTLVMIFSATLLGVTCGLLIGVLDNVGLGIILSIVLGITGIVLGDVGKGEIRGIAIAVVSGLVAGTVKGSKWGRLSGILAGMLGGLSWILASISVTGLTESIVLGGILVACVFFFCYMIGYHRIPLYLVSSISGLWAYIASERNNTTVFLNLHKSSLYWDESVFLPLPMLRRTLLIASEQNVERTLHEIDFIVRQRPQQKRTAQMTAIEIALCDLKKRETIHEIAAASQRLKELLPQEVILYESGLVTPFAHLIEVSLGAKRYTGPFNWQIQREALETMLQTMNKIYPDTAFPNAQLNLLLTDITANWHRAITYQQKKLVQGGGGMGQISNPYKVGNPLELGDTLFVGRRDVVPQLIRSLSKPNRPTFLLNGERRMGKSSMLQQLPRLLGPSYIPVLYDFESPSFYSSIESLFAKISEKIYKTVYLRGIYVQKLKNSRLYDALQRNEAAVYRPFDEWLDVVERALQRKDLTLLLLFDEFESLEHARKAGYIDLDLLLDWFRNTIQNRSSVALLFCGVHTFGEMDENWASHFVNAKTFRVSFLKPEEAHDLITKPVPDFPAERIFATAIVEEIIRVTACHPFLVQAICSELIDNLNCENREYVKMQDVANAVSNVLENWGDTYFRDLWIHTDQQQRTCLTLLSQRGASDVSEIVTSSGLDEQIVLHVLQNLLKRDLVLQEQESYRITAPILEQWILRQPPNSKALITKIKN